MNAEYVEADDERSTRRSRKFTAALLFIIALLFIWYLVSDRLTPYTASARVQAYVVAVVPDVSGYIASVPIKKNQLIEAGDPLVKIETARFELAVEAAEAALEVAGQGVGASTASVSAATAKLAEAQAELNETRVQAERIFVLEEKGVYAAAKGDQARADVATKEAQVNAAQAELERAKSELGSDGQDNPRVRAALAQLEEARLNLSRTSINAPSLGFVGGLKVDEGAYASAGQPLMTFIAVEDIWIEAFLTENNLSNIKPGDKVELAFDAYPGRIFHGKVKSSAVGVSTGKAVNLGDLPTAQANRGWMRDPQRFPVIIETTDYKHEYTSDKPGGVRLNSQVDVIVYTGDHFFWNALAGFWIRLVSWFSYLY